MLIDKHKILRLLTITVSAFFACVFFTVSLSMQTQAATDLPKVGIVGAVNPDSEETLPGSAPRTVQFGGQVIFREKIKTTATGSLQLAFLDKSTLNIGPNSEMVIDEFVYDPDKGEGKMALSLTKGVMRFVGGQISHTSGVEVTTPVATIGMRGAAGLISYDPEKGANVISSYGKFDIKTPQGSTQISRPGFSVTVGSQDAAPSSPTKVTQQQLDSTTSQIASNGKQTGGAPVAPSEGQATTQLGNNSLTTSPSTVTSLAGNASNTQLKSLTPIIPAAVTPQIISTASATSTTSSNSVTSYKAGRAFALSMTSGAGSRFPYVSGAFFGNGSVLVSPVLGYRNAQTTTSSAPNSALLQVGLSINGQGTAQSSSFFVMTGGLNQYNATYVFSGGVFASGRQSATASPSFDTTSVSSVPGSVQTSSAFVPTSLTVNQNNINYANGAVIAETGTAYGGPVGPSSQNQYSYTQSASTTSLPSGVGNSRPAQNLVGYVGGTLLSELFPDSSATNSTSSTNYNTTGTISIQTNPTTSRATATIATNANYNNADVLNQGNFVLGNLDTSQRSRSAYIDQTTFALREQVITVNAASNATAQTSSYATNNYGSGTYGSGNVALTTWSALAANDPTTAQSFFPGVAICNCAYSQWGFWSVAENRNTGTGSAYISDRGNLLLWVAGELADPSLIPNSGSATYNGQVIANIRNALSGTYNSYVAGANFSHVVNFGKQQGTLNIANLDGINYSGTTQINSGTSTFNGNFTATGGQNISGNLKGSYYGVSSPPEEIGGQFSLTNPAVNGSSSYYGAGIFQGKR